MTMSEKTPAPVGAAVALDLDAIEARQKAAASARWEIIGDRDGPRALMALLGEDVPALVAEVATLRARLAAVEAKRDEFADLLARALPAVAALARVEALGDSNPDHADTCGSMLTPGAGYPCSCWQADLRAALATTGEGQ